MFPRSPGAPARRTVFAVGLVVLVGLGLSGCRSGRVDGDLFPESTAVVRCTKSGRLRETPRDWLAFPVPRPPTGMFARAMDPAALDELGFQRDASVCAALEAPSSDEVEVVASSLGALDEALARADMELRARSGCGCVEARRQSADHLFASCRRVRRRDCPDDAALTADVAEMVTDLRGKIADVSLPKRHWRLFGTADRPDRIAVRFPDVVGMYEGGSELFVPGQEPGGGRSDELVAALLAEPEVVAVIRQDGGTAMLVVRSHRGQLVLDHFAYDRLSDRYGRLVSELDRAHIDWHRARLELGSGGGRPEFHFSPSDGSFMGVYGEPLAQVDAMVEAAARMQGLRYDRSQEISKRPPVLVDRVEISLPGSADGGSFEAWVHLTAEGVEVVDAATEDQLSVQFGDLAFDDQQPIFEPDEPLDFVGRGQPVERTLLDGIHGFFSVLETVERAQPGAVVGNLDELTVNFPSGPLPGELETRPGLQSLRELLSKQRHVLTARRAGAAFEISVRAAP